MGRLATRVTIVFEAYGGVVITGDVKVLLREPRDHFGGYIWTFPKGRPEHGETPEVTALREVLEETGIEARILQRVPGTFAGSMGENVYFLMRPIRETGCWDHETQAICWVTPAEAEGLIRQTLDPLGVQRDLNVLAAALQLLHPKGG